jgi:hypothetical protein
MTDMTPPILDATAMNIIVGLALVFAAAFVVAWAVSPRLRAWIEKPNYRFRQNARTYDESLKVSNNLSNQRERNWQ